MKEPIISDELKNTLPWRLFLVFILFTVGIILMGVSFYKSQKSRIFSEQETNLKTIASLKIGQITSWYSERIEDAEVIKENLPLIKSSELFFRNPDSKELTTELKKWMEAVNKGYDYCGVLLLDTLLNVRLTVVPSDTVPGNDIRPKLMETLKKGSILIVDIHNSGTPDYVHMDILVPLINTENKTRYPIGVVILRIDPSRSLFHLVQSWPTSSKSSETLLLRKEADSVIYLNELRHVKNTALKLSMPLSNKELLASKVAIGERGIVEGVDYRNVPVLGYLRSIPGTPWFMVAKTDKEELRTPVKRYFTISIIVTLLLVLINAFLFSFWIWDQRVKLYHRQVENERYARESAEKLNKSEELYRRLFDNMLNGFAYCRMLYEREKPFDFIYLSVNKAFETHTGLMNVVGRKVSEVIPGILESDPELIERYGRVALTGKPEVFELYLESLKMWFSISVYSPQKDYFVAVFDVITERKEIEKKLKESEERFRSLYENITIGMYRTTMDGQILLANPAMLNMMGFDSFEQLAQRNLEKEGYEPEYPRSRFHETMEKLGKVTGLESAWKKRDGTVLFVRESASAVRDKNGKILYYDGTVEDITHRKKIERALEDERNLLRTLMDLLPSIIFVKDRESRFLMANSTCAEFMGAASPQELIGKTDFEFYQSEVADAFRSDELDVLNGIPLINKEEGSYSPTGNPRNLLTTKVPLRDGKGNIIGLVGTCFDITERKIVEEALIESEDKFKYVFEHSAVGKSITLITGEINVNTAFCNMLGFNPDELKLIKWSEISHPADLELTNRELNKLLSGEQKSIRFIKRYIHKNGSVVWCDLSTSLRRDSNNKPLYYMTTVNDITEKKKAEEALRLKNLVFDASIAANSIADLNGNITEANNSFISLWGYPDKKSIIGKPISDFLKYSEEVDTIVNVLQNVGKWEGRYTALRMDGSLFIAHGLATVVKDETGNVIGSQSAVIDVTEVKHQEDEIKRLNEELEQKVIQRTRQLESANKELEAFSYSVSHDLRSPLRAVHSYTNILLQDYEKDLDSEGKRLCGIISASATQMGELIDDLLNFSRIGRSSLNPSILDMRKIVTSIVNEISGDNKKGKPKFNIGKLHKVKGDPNLIKHVWNNLISNAIKYSSKKKVPEIEIESNLDGEMITYSVKDNGVGFDMQYKHKLFGVFQRLHTENEFEGNGVGLAIVQRIISRHGGRVKAEGKVGKGATFCFSLPVDSKDKG